MKLDVLSYRIRPVADPEGALVLFHGRGADENDLFPLLDLLDPERRLVGATPRGPLSLPPGGAHWYVVREIGFPDKETFDASYELASAWLAAFAAETGVSPEQTVLGGFSQGAVMTYALGLGRGRPRPAGLIALSGFIPTAEGFELDLSTPLPPVAIGHGTYDPSSRSSGAGAPSSNSSRRAPMSSIASTRSPTRSTRATFPSSPPGSRHTPRSRRTHRPRLCQPGLDGRPGEAVPSSESASPASAFAPSRMRASTAE